MLPETASPHPGDQRGAVRVRRARHDPVWTLVGSIPIVRSTPAWSRLRWWGWVDQVRKEEVCSKLLVPDVKLPCCIDIKQPSLLKFQRFVEEREQRYIKVTFVIFAKVTRSNGDFLDDFIIK